MTRIQKLALAGAAVLSLGMGMTEGILREWLVADGASVQEGTAIYSLESEKAIEEVASPSAGVLRIKADIGETYLVGELIGTIE